AEAESGADAGAEAGEDTAQVADAPPTLPAVAAIAAEASDETYRGLPVGFTEDGRIYRGNPDAPLVMIEFSDYQCPFCNRYFVQTEPALDEAYVRTGDVLVVFHDFPLVQLHPQAPTAHAVTRCVAEQGSAADVWELRSEIFRSVDDWSTATDPLEVFARLTETVGADADAMLACMEAGTYTAEVEARVQEAADAGFSGTPSFQIVRRADNGVFQMVGAQPYDQFANLIDTLLAGETPQTAQAGDQPPADDGPPVWAMPEGLAPDPDRPGYTMAGDAYRGNPDARVAVVEFSDFQCPFCRRHQQDTQPTLEENYVDTGEVFWVFKHFPLSIHPQAPMAGAAAECAGDQGQFWPMHDLLFETVERWGVADPGPVLIEIAGELDLDIDAFTTCMAGDEAIGRVESDLADGGQYVRGTPTFIILYNGEGSIVPGALPLETFVEVMDEILAEAQ
ncbi:MAG: thioredoxin domain-containing protein, partial [Litorilinea sp.]